MPEEHHGLPKAHVNVTHPYLALMGLYLGGFTGMYSETALNIALPQISAAFGIDISLTQWLVVGYMLAIGIVLPFASLLMKWFPTRKLTVFALGAFFAGSLASGLAPSFEIALAGRAVQGIGTGIVLPLMFAMVMEVIPPHKLGSAMGVTALVIMFAPAVGPTLAGFLVDAASWRFIFFSFAIILMVAIAFALKFEVDPYELSRPRIDRASVVLSCLGFGGIVNAIVSMLAGKIYDRIGARIPALVGFGLSAFSAAALLFATPGSPIVFVIACHVTMMIGVPLAMSPCQTHALSSLPHQLSADGSTILNTMQQVLGAVCTAVATNLLASGKQAFFSTGGTDPAFAFAQGSHWGFLFTLALALVGFLLASRIKTTEKKAASVDSACSPDPSASIAG